MKRHLRNPSSLGGFLYEFDQATDVVDGRLGQDSMPQVKDVTGPACGLLQYLLRPAANVIWCRQKTCRVQVPLHGEFWAYPVPCFGQPNAPVYTYDCGARFG